MGGLVGRWVQGGSAGTSTAINDLNGKHLRENVLAASVHGGTDKRTHDPPLPLSRVRRFARRARTNRCVLEQVPSKAAADLADGGVE